MTRFIFIVLICFLFSCSHYSKLDGLYFSDQQDCLGIDGKTGAIETKARPVVDDLTVKQNRRKIKFLFTTRNKLHIRHKKKYSFRIAYNHEDSVMVAPLSKSAKLYYDKRPYLLLKPKYAFAEPIVFDTIIYHSSRCFGTCHDLHMKIDKYGNLQVTDNGDGFSDTLRNGNYVGRLSANEKERLYNILKYSQLRRLEWPERKCFDAPVLTLIVYTNGQRYYFKAMDFCVPIVSYELTKFLSRQFFNKSLQKVEERFTYEQ